MGPEIQNFKTPSPFPKRQTESHKLDCAREITVVSRDPVYITEEQDLEVTELILFKSFFLKNVFSLFVCVPMYVCDRGRETGL